MVILDCALQLFAGGALMLIILLTVLHQSHRIWFVSLDNNRTETTDCTFTAWQGAMENEFSRIEVRFVLPNRTVF